MRMLTFDIETRPHIGAVWGKYEQDVIWWERYGGIIAIGWKWSDEKQGHVRGLPDYPGYRVGKEDDRKLLIEFCKVAEGADIFIFQNGDKFDLPYINARLLFHRLPPLQPRQTIDTLKMFRKMHFPANNLDEVCAYLGIGRKVRTDKNLWKDCLDPNLSQEERDRAWKHMTKYCLHDVELTEEAARRILPYSPNTPNFNVYEHTLRRCTNPACGSTKLQKRGVRRTTTGQTQAYQCQACGKYSQSAIESVHTKEGKKHMLR